MLNQTSTEALYSATYVENYLDCVDNLPGDLQRQLTRLRELDVTYRTCLRDVQTYLDLCASVEANATAATKARKARHMARVRAALIQAQDIGDEKLQVVQIVQDLIDNRARSLDTDYRKLMACIEVSTNGTLKDEPQNLDLTTRESLNQNQASLQSRVTPPSATPPHSHDREKDKGDKDKNNGERGAKRARRGRGAENTSDEREDNQRNNSNLQKKGLGKKKKRKTRGQSVQQTRSETPPEETIDPDEPRYCLCDQISYGEMILCDNDLCPIEWFHFSCVYLTIKPKGKWFCPKCRGDRPNVMKPKSQFLKELERYNKEKEEKA